MNGRSRGFTLVETLVVVALGLVLIGGIATLSNAPAASASSALALPRLIDEARVLAALSGDGATVVLRPGLGAEARSFEVAIFRYRPRAGGSLDPAHPDRSERLPGILSSSLGGAAPLAIFISTAGTVSYAAWPASSATFPIEPACLAPLEIVIATGFAATPLRFALACTDARLVPG
jgi:prepilin-type N-terminal cleavage/methylation domain-containing protein